MKNVSVRFWCAGYNFFGGEELGFNERGNFVISGFTTLPDSFGRRGTYFSSLAISSKEYREKYPTQCGFKVTSKKSITLYDDWRKPFSISSNSPKLIKALEIECLANNLPRVS